ncbi:MAG: TIGR00730 family Rossman fold protein [Candidatus Micrarchaeota archaeon]|nr:TIGR00730 family Rossman fold protein [Candidatus Micrarchaeota archaeon]
MSERFKPNTKNIAVWAPPSSRSFKLSKSFFRKNGKHLDKNSAIELFKEDVLLAEKMLDNSATVAVFGSARVSNTFHKNLADASYSLGYMLGKRGFVISTGGGPGIMEFVSRGATDAKSLAIGFQPKFLEKSEPPILFDGKIHYFVYSLHSRKILMANNALAFVFFPGGAGTVDEFFHYLNFAKNGWIKNIKFILFDSKFWSGLVKWVEKLLNNGFITKQVFENIVLVDDIKQVNEIILSTKKPTVQYCPNPIKLSINFEQDIKELYNYIEKLSHPSASFFGNVNTKKMSTMFSYLVNKLQEMNFTIYYSSQNGLASFFQKNQANSKNINFEISLNLLETKKLVLGATDVLFFLNSDLECIDALTEYIVRIQMGDMEKVFINLLEPTFWKDYFKWFYNYPVSYGFAEEELLGLCKFVYSKKDLIVP